LVNEYLVDDTYALYHADVVRELAEARLDFVASANIGDDEIRFTVPEALQEFVQSGSDQTWRETLKDFITNKQFRRDIFVRGANRLNDYEKTTLLNEVTFALMVPPSQLRFTFTVPVGEVRGKEDVYRAITNALVDGPKTYGCIRELAELRSLADASLRQSIDLLVRSGQIHPITLPQSTKSATAFNKAVIERTFAGENLKHLASPIVGTGVPVDFSDIMALDGTIRGDVPEVTAAKAWEIMSRTGRRLMKNGEVLRDREANTLEQLERIAAFNEIKFPIFHSLGIL
jgi:hypothetical protein